MFILFQKVKKLYLLLSVKEIGTTLIEKKLIDLLSFLHQKPFQSFQSKQCNEAW